MPLPPEPQQPDFKLPPKPATPPPTERWYKTDTPGLEYNKDGQRRYIPPKK